jgi:hypothetical protein
LKSTLVENPPFSTSHFSLHVIFDYKFLNIKKNWGSQVSWTIYSFGEQLKVNLN